ncbi:DNA polymerase subunit Cdc27 [Umbelopsis sp. AD052]|nr:DNA polymerase subunit Cdc27 [Umbelopsis sp. AD052]
MCSSSSKKSAQLPKRVPRKSRVSKKIATKQKFQKPNILFFLRDLESACISMAQHLDYLEVALTQENTPVTYRTLSRKANINVTAAKKLLYQFVSTTKHNVSATYCISGEGLTSIPGNEPTQTIRLVDAEDLEEARKQFKYISGVHIYSVQPSKLKDHSVLVTASSDLPTYSLADLPRLGIIRDTSITTSESRQAAPPPSSHPKAAAASKPPSAPTPVSKPIPAKQQTKAQANQEKANQKKSEQRNVASLFSAAAAKKDKPVAKPKPIAQPAPVSESAPSKSRNVKKIQSDSEEEEDDEEMDRRLAASSRQADSVEDFWKDEEVDPVSPSKTNSAQEADSEATPINQPDDTDIAEAEEVIVTKPADEDVQAPRERRRLKRKVLKKKHYKDESGYLVTDDVYEWESYSEEETTEPVLKRKAPPASPSKNDSKKSAKKGSAADQKSLLSFWGKK